MVRLGKELWIALAIIVIVILTTLMLIAILDDEAKSQVDVCVTPEQRDTIRPIMLNAVNKGLEEQIEHLFQNWVKDPAGQPKRAQVGANNAIKAFIRARAAALAWAPAECDVGFQLQSAGAKPWR